MNTSKYSLLDLDAEPFVPKGWWVEEHRQGGQFAWDPTKVNLHLEPEQQNGKAIDGDELYMRLKRQSVLNANALDYLLANPELIPDEWKGKKIFFWGTIYRHAGIGLFVRYLFWRGDRWDWHSSWFLCGWRSGGPAAVLASA